MPNEAVCQEKLIKNLKVLFPECANVDPLKAHVYFNDSLLSGPENCVCKKCQT